MVRLAIVLSLIPFWVQAQTVDTFYIGIDIAEKMPVYSDSLGLYSFIQKNVCYPKSACIDSIEGTIFIQYYVEIDGNTTGHHLINKIREDLDSEAMRVAKLIVYKESATQRGKPVRIRSMVPVVFRLKDCVN